MNKVVLLVRKDLIYLFTSLKKLIFMSVIFSVVMPMGNVMFAFAIPVMMGYLLTYGIFAYEEKNKMHLLNASLPVNRKEICLCKYLTAFICIGASILMTILGASISIGMQIANGWQGSLDFMVRIIGLLFTTALIYHAAILPLIIYFGTIKVKYIIFMLYVGAFVVIGSIGGQGLNRTQLFLEERLTYTSSLLLLMAGTMLYIISYFISIGLYYHKEFR